MVQIEKTINEGTQLRAYSSSLQSSVIACPHDASVITINLVPDVQSSYQIPGKEGFVETKKRF